jgi:hypothetical protein
MNFKALESGFEIAHDSFWQVLRRGMAKPTMGVGRTTTPDLNLMALQNDASETALYMAAENNLLDLFRYDTCSSSLIFRLMIRFKSNMDAFHVIAKHSHLGILLELLLCFGFSLFFFFSFFHI